MTIKKRCESEAIITLLQNKSVSPDEKPNYDYRLINDALSITLPVRDMSCRKL